jgi:hypothetical protein
MHVGRQVGRIEATIWDRDSGAGIVLDWEGRIP